jgi:hypothetical protein
MHTRFDALIGGLLVLIACVLVACVIVIYLIIHQPSQPCLGEKHFSHWQRIGRVYVPAYDCID